MHAELNAQLAFHLTGVRHAHGGLAPVDTLGLRPALLGRYRDLAALRYDYPLVLTEAGADFAVPLSQLVDRALEGVSDTRQRRQALVREREIRSRLAGGLGGKLSTLWTGAPALGADGELADCDAALPTRFFTAAWSRVQAERTRRFREEADRLVVQLSGILATDFVQSDEGRTAERLAASLAAREGTFDTTVMSRLLAKALPERRLPSRRRRRLRSLTALLKNQRFFANGTQAAKPYPFLFQSCSSALRAMQERHGPAVELSRAMAAARLEATGEYIEAEHDALLEEFAENAAGRTLLPAYLVCVNALDLEHSSESAALAELLASGMPVKVLVQHDDLFDTTATNAPSFGIHARLLSGMALGLNEVFLFQAPASHLHALRARILQGLEYPGASLFSVFSGALEEAPGLPAYLVAAAALEARVFPAFTYDPAAAPGARFSLEGNPQPQADWPRHAFDYEDAAHQRVQQELAFTAADFAACDRRCGRYFALVGRTAAREDVPSVALVDRQDVLRTAVVAEPLARAVHSCLDAWHALQAQVARPAAPSAPAPVAETAPAQPEPPKPAAAAAAPAKPAPAAAAEPAANAAPAPDAPYIETPRCTTCEECIKINNRLFVYDENKQAYIADPKLGSYRELVEAAESCQVSIIHPGKPLDPGEPGLAELLERAAPFA